MRTIIRIHILPLLVGIIAKSDDSVDLSAVIEVEEIGETEEVNIGGTVIITGPVDNCETAWAGWGEWSAFLPACINENETKNPTRYRKRKCQNQNTACEY